MAMDTFQVVIDQFPNDVTFDAEGTTSRNVAAHARWELEQF
jgi:hypothetical protein